MRVLTVIQVLPVHPARAAAAVTGKASVHCGNTFKPGLANMQWLGASSGSYFSIRSIASPCHGRLSPTIVCGPRAARAGAANRGTGPA